MAHLVRSIIALLACLLLVTGCDKEEEAPEPIRLASPSLYSTDQLAPRVLAERNLRGLFDQSIEYFEGLRDSTLGDALPLQFPASVSLTPATMPCGDPVEANPADWDHPTWRALHFLPTNPLRYSYTYESSGTGREATFTVTAYGDIDCDGVVATFRKTGIILPSGNIQGVGDLFTENPDD